MDQLDFQDHPYEETSGKAVPSAPQEQTVEFSDFPPDATEDQQESGVEDSSEGENKTSPSIFTLAYYQQYFDVDTFDVGNRLLSSVIPNPNRNYLEHVIRPKPDLYGPFWVCATLTFSIAITGNIADFFHSSGKDFQWKYNYGLVSLAATVIFSYWLIIPGIIWCILRWRGSLAGYTLTELVCVYGYSLAIFVPCSVLWLIPGTWVKILLAVVCSLVSGTTLLITLYPAVKNDSKQVMAIFMILVIALHALLATGFVLYFFKYTDTSSGIQPPHTNTTMDHSLQQPPSPSSSKPPNLSAHFQKPEPTTSTNKTKRDGHQSMTDVTSTRETNTDTGGDTYSNKTISKLAT